MALLEVRDFSFAFPANGSEIKSQRTENTDGSELKNQPQKDEESTGLVLSSVSMTIEDGSFTVLLGPNGGGKTTLLRQLHPILADTGTHTGKILWNNEALDAKYTAQKARIGFVQQRSQAQIVTDKVWHELAFGLENQGLDAQLIRQKVAEVATFFGIKDWFHMNVSELSGGQRQILNLASSMVLNPQLLILDEPTAQLDPISTDSFLQMLHRLNYELGVTVLLAEHELHKILPYASQVLFMANGTVSISGSPREAVPHIARLYPQFVNALPLATQLFEAARGRQVVDSSVEASDRGDRGDGSADPNSIDVSRETIETSSAEQAIPLTIGEGRRWLAQEVAVRTGTGSVSQLNGRVTSTGFTGHEGPVEHEVNAELADPTHPQWRAATGRAKPAVEVRDVSFKFSARDDDLLRDVNLTVNPGEIFALVGSNGSGKSTFMSILSGLRQPYRGRVTIEGHRLSTMDRSTLYNHFLGVLPQDPQTLFVHQTVFDDLADVFSRSTHKVTVTENERARIESGAEAFGLTDLLGRHPYDLSGGELQMAALLKILLLEPRVLLLDEPTKGLDETAKQRTINLFRSLSSQGVTTVFVTHDVEFAARSADRAGLFFDGQVVSVAEVHEFFSTNNFYTTGASRIARDWFPTAITKDEVAACLRK